MTCRVCGEAKPLGGEFWRRQAKARTGWRSTCKSCLKEQDAAYRSNNPEAEARHKLWRSRPENKAKIAANGRKWQKENPEAVREKSKRWRDRNPGGARAATQKYRKSNASKVRAMWREWHSRNADQVRASQRARYAEDPLKYIAIAQNARARRLSAPGAWTNLDIGRKFSDQKGCCYYCGCRVGRGKDWDQPWHADHFIPLARGGTNFPDNLVVACAPCNTSKNAKMPWEWMPDRFSPPPNSFAPAPAGLFFSRRS